MGIMPRIIASAVISTGRNRTKPALSADSDASPTVTSSCSRAKVITRIEFEVATPMHMMAPVSAGTLRRVWVRNRNQTMPEMAAGSAHTMMNGSSHDWKFTTMSR